MQCLCVLVCACACVGVCEEMMMFFQHPQIVFSNCYVLYKDELLTLSSTGK